MVSPNSGRSSPAPSRNSVTSSVVNSNQRESQDMGNKSVSFVPFDEDEKRELLLCMVFILKTLSSGMGPSLFGKPESRAPCIQSLKVEQHKYREIHNYMKNVK